jgi:5'-3' exonuclease
MARLMLLDGNGLIYRGYFALPPLTTSKGQLVNAVFGFCSIVLRGVQDLQPEYWAVSFDLGKPTFRHEAYAEYKATRQRMPDDLRDQFPKVREVVKALRIPVYELEGYEADDVIATLVDQAEADGLDTTVVTGDLDMLQLVSERTSLMTTRMGVQNTVIYDVAKVADRYGLRPEQMIDFKSLKGDSTDNIPGVPGVGEKTAAKLIGDWQTLENLFEHLDEVTPPKLRGPLTEARARVLDSRELMRLVHGLPVSLDLDEARLGDYDRETVIRLFREFEFRTLIERLPPLTGERADDTARALSVSAADPSFPAAKVVGRPEGWGAGEPAVEREFRGGGNGQRPSLIGQGSGLQLSLVLDAVGGQGQPSAPDEAGTAAVPRALEPGDLAAALRAAIADPGRIERLETAADVGTLEDWLRSQPSVGVAYLRDDPRPRKGQPLALGLTGADGRTVSVDDPEAIASARALLVRVGTPLVGHEVKPVLTAQFADDPAAAPMTIAFDTQVAAYLLNASLRSQAIADVAAERLDAILPPPAAGLPPYARAGLEALAAAAVREPLANALVAEGLDRLFAEI